MKLTTKKELNFVIILILLGQLSFLLMSSAFTEVRFVGRIYATTGVAHKQEDLHKLNEAAHYFGQTIIGWLKFPSFMRQLGDVVDLPADASISAHIQERQNIIFVLEASESPELDTLKEVKNYIQSKLDEYNSVSQTKFVLSNLDYEILELQKSYAFGAVIALLVSVALGAGLIFVFREFS